MTVQKDLKERLIDDIEKLPAHTKLPSRTELSAQYYVSRQTMDVVINTLCREGYLYALRGAECDKATLRRALERTTEKRGSSKILTQYSEIMQEIRDSDTLRRQWNKYGMEYDYAKDISFDDTCNAVQKIMNELNLER